MISHQINKLNSYHIKPHHSDIETACFDKIKCVITMDVYLVQVIKDTELDRFFCELMLYGTPIGQTQPSLQEKWINIK